jgi:hypothetical protein
MVELVDYSVSYGECVGYCTSILTIEGTAVELVQTSNDSGEPRRRFTGGIDPHLGQRIGEEAAKLDPQGLRTTYGTPDARDEGAVTVRIRGVTGVTEHRYSRGGPPIEFAALDALLSPVLLGWVDGDSPVGLRFDDSP